MVCNPILLAAHIVPGYSSSNMQDEIAKHATKINSLTTICGRKIIMFAWSHNVFYTSILHILLI